MNLQQEDPVAKCLELTNGLGADLVVECSGEQPAIASTPQYVSKMGRICAIGLTGKKPVQLGWAAFQGRVCTVIFNMSTFYTSWKKALSMLGSGKINARAIITHEFPLEQWEAAFEAVENLTALKAVLIP